ncbi:hypothetical protein SAMN05421578_10298 [Paenibacillus macquariensis]|uniref:Uncharacterized protein n=1 Tax=Paenibacillus macquariensis TaxID=948756 RepID=A0ABY1JMJ4_9BACL|nr:hypothetical protein SAMN05421578_10298 [Paenibacillus macquariensis]
MAVSLDLLMEDRVDGGQIIKAKEIMIGNDKFNEIALGWECY